MKILHTQILFLRLLIKLPFIYHIVDGCFNQLQVKITFKLGMTWPIKAMFHSICNLIKKSYFISKNYLEELRIWRRDQPPESTRFDLSICKIGRSSTLPHTWLVLIFSVSLNLLPTGPYEQDTKTLRSIQTFV